MTELERSDEMLGLLIDINNLMAQVREKLERYKELSGQGPASSASEVELFKGEAEDQMRARNQQ